MATSMRRMLAAGVVVLLGVVVALQAAEDKKPAKEVTLKGTICCSKCELSETAACGTVIKVKEDGKDVIYYFDDKGKAEKYHETICAEPKKGSVTGVVTIKDKKKHIKPSKDGVKFE